ncbi:hypothetical protein CCYS_12165 [Corynebacterium cystitidis DSM 20524]|uniref:Transposase n=1 Tax=Corynebacterium cystitidis DSM 20524 TaxID=1121357 RepID=A0A1H9V616_9CORY|nr:hypothetical protein CCYS_12165 [Corynebacterium cystitidis DSM 20524]SES17280.1 hypothetical protein SAMN05661109_02094 [Corynebacterium cystitidis DSM 20524]SNV63340.1 transposase [Corynebacterium cystitidis]
MPKKYSVEFKEKAVHQIVEMVRLESCSLQRAYEKVGELLWVSHHTLRAWYRESITARDNGEPSGGESMEEELKRLRRENRELKRANGILKTASAFSRRNSTDPQPDDLLHRRLQGAVWGRGHLPRSFTDRSWFHHVPRLPESQDTHPQC